jgi:hypothetical protein
VRVCREREGGREGGRERERESERERKREIDLRKNGSAQGNVFRLARASVVCTHSCVGESRRAHVDAECRVLAGKHLGIKVNAHFTESVRHLQIS